MNSDVRRDITLWLACQNLMHGNLAYNGEDVERRGSPHTR